MKKKTPTTKPSKGTSEAKDDKSNNIHQVRRRIEDILLEREQKERLDL
ncbi:hypothetical protein VIBRN418_17273 [Vibrio sp. N418]|uniref:Uncharacterized protein n=1 Tax=Vibrio scophthalmi LMG 19158 TaxID=870967 RepID=F9RMW2_9VIBR|nr:hypothetical protein VIBRN418_17273 [Vibrio sp. N418]EGU37906.1 hypothetical protein VIS19158_00705 [Vibrio scophthalmi LMG 19158]